MVFVKMFADHFGLSEKQAFNYLDAHKGFDGRSWVCACGLLLCFALAKWREKAGDC